MKEQINCDISTKWTIYSAVEGNPLSSHEKTQVGILLSERSQSEKATRCMIPTVGHSGKDRRIHKVNKLLVARGGER